MFGWLVSAYPMVVIPAPTTEVYYQLLSGYSPERLKAAMLNHVRRTRFFPSVAELVELIEAEPCPHAEKAPVNDFPPWRGERCTECGREWWSSA